METASQISKIKILFDLVSSLIPVLGCCAKLGNIIRKNILGRKIIEFSLI
jgi:hypothetical protein